MISYDDYEYRKFAGYAPEPVQDLWEPEDDDYEFYDEYQEEDDEKV